MIATPRALDHRSLPRKKRPPTPRDQAIYLAYRTAGITQAKLADDYHLSQRRISEIIKRVERWRADLIPAAAGELDDRQSQRLERWIEQQRLQSIYDRAIRGYDTQSRELKTTRQGDRDGKPYRDETTRELPPNVQLLKVALRAAEDLGKLTDKPAPAAPDAHSTHQRFWKAHALIRELRRDNGLTEDESLWSNESALIAQALDRLIGKESATDQDPAPAPASPTRSVSEEEETRSVSEEEETKLETIKSSNRSNPSPSHSPQFPATSTTATADPPTTLDLGPRTLDPNSPTPKNPDSDLRPLTPDLQPLPPTPTPAERRRRHQERLDQLQEARRRGFPCLIEFDPADGPLPPTYFHLDGVGY